jgi:hypothetical protein
VDAAEPRLDAPARPLNDPLEELDELGALGDLTTRTGHEELAGSRRPAPDRVDLGLGARTGAAGTGLNTGLGAGLARRTPQASLAEELRRSDQEAGSPPAPAVPHQALDRDPLRTSSALSRFQATQRAGRAAPDPEEPR